MLLESLFQKKEEKKGPLWEIVKIILSSLILSWGIDLLTYCRVDVLSFMLKLWDIFQFKKTLQSNNQAIQQWTAYFLP